MGRMDDFISTNPGGDNSTKGDSARVVRIETTGVFGLGLTECMFDDSTGELIGRTRPTVVESVPWPASAFMPPKVEDRPAACPGFFKCESCPNREQTQVEVTGEKLLAAERLENVIRDGLY